MSAAEALREAHERRAARRQRCFRLARCVFNGARSDLDVTIRNISETGVRIMGDGLICLPEEFELHIHDGFGQYSVRRVRRAWMKGHTAGLAFLD